jgi:hypothetical protein
MWWYKKVRTDFVHDGSFFLFHFRYFPLVLVTNVLTHEITHFS